MTIRPISVLALIGVTVLLVPLAALTSAAGEPNPRLIFITLVLLGVIGVRALRVARSGRAADWDEPAEPAVGYERIGCLEQGLIVLGWFVVAVVVLMVIVFASTALGLEGAPATIVGFLTLGSVAGILIAGPILTLRHLMRRSTRR